MHVTVREADGGTLVMAAVAEPPPDIRTCGPYARCTYRALPAAAVNVAMVGAGGIRLGATLLQTYVRVPCARAARA